ncbi:hypothetical protein [Nocardia sp. CY41]|uniref:hypothetical protein n=1 Tax=Nocardia sp. CY41 TaxID=2608686 RepID=UPI00135A26D1|nr:hypothetical protein [Nocardia sp. CY41]
MRLRILELPMLHVGNYSGTPFALVFDQCTQDDATAIAATRGSLKASTGAQAVLAFESTVDLD